MEYTRGPVCGIDNCRSKRYHQGEDGFTYCFYGHKRDAGLVTINEGFHAGQAFSQTTRRQEETEEAEETVLGKKDMMVLCLQCFQLVLWKQASWLVNVKKYPPELETVIRDLWVLRLQMLNTLIEDPDEARAAKMFSTQSDTENSDGERGTASVSQAALRQRAPRLIESVAICYLAVILLRIPICAGDVHGWIMSEGFNYLSALINLPQEMKQRLSPSMKTKFYVKIGAAKLDKFHRTVIVLAEAFKASAGLIFPPINHHLLLFRFISDLALPYVFPAAEQLARILDHRFAFPSRFSGQIHQYQYPEFQLISTLIVATKLLYPFDSDEVLRNPTHATSLAAFVIDWAAWNEARDRYASSEESREKSSQRLNAALLATTEKEVFAMSGAQLDSYLDWFDKTWLGGGGGGGDEEEEERDEKLAASTWQARRSAPHTEFRKAMFRFFPRGAAPGGAGAGGDAAGQVGSEAAAAEDVMEATPIGEWETNGLEFYDKPTLARIDRIRAVQSTLLQRNPIAETLHDEQGDDGAGHGQNDTEILRPGSRYTTYRTLGAVPKNAKVFFEDAAKLVGLPIKELLVAVSQVEGKLQKWVAHKKSKSKIKSDVVRKPKVKPVKVPGRKRGRPRKTSETGVASETSERNETNRIDAEGDAEMETL